MKESCCACAGEIIPQAVCSRYGLQVGAYSAWFVRVLMWLCCVIAWPISKILDSLLGHEQAVSLPCALPQTAYQHHCATSQDWQLRVHDAGLPP